MAKAPKNSPTLDTPPGSRVELRGRRVFGEVIYAWPLMMKPAAPLAVMVAWDWGSEVYNKSAEENQFPPLVCGATELTLC